MSRRRITFHQIDDFFRIYQIGFVAVWPILGLASANAWTGTSVAALVLISASFNVFGGVLNDVCDLDSDRQCRDRQHRWLVTGAVSARTGLTVALLQLPIMAAIHVAAGFRAASLPWLATAALGQALYDVRGKKSRTPPATELGQAVAAACLVCYGASCSIDRMSIRTALTAVAAASMLQLANAFHGGLRDLADDLRAGVRTTPIWLGCRLRQDDVAISTAMSVYGACWLGLMMGASLAVTPESSPMTRAITTVECASVVILFAALHRLRGPAWGLMLRVHVTLMMIPIMTAYTAVLGPGGSVVVGLVYAVPALPLAYRIVRATVLRRHAGVTLADRRVVFERGDAHVGCAMSGQNVPP